MDGQHRGRCRQLTCPGCRHEIVLDGNERRDIRHIKDRGYRKASLILCILLVLLLLRGGKSIASPDVPGGSTSDGLDHYVYLPCIRREGVFPRGGSRLGLHTLRPNNAYGFVRGVHDAGARVALVKVLDVFGYLRFMKETSLETVTVARWNGVAVVDPEGDPAEKTASVMDQHMPRWRYEQGVVDYWEVLNEPAPPTVTGHVWLAQFYIAAMDIAEANGYRLALFS